MADSDKIHNLLIKCTLNDFNRLTHLVASRLCTKKSVHYESFSEIWTLEEWWIVTEFLEDTLTNSVRNRLTKDEISSLLKSVPDDYKQNIIDVITVRKNDIHQYLLLKTSSISQNKLTDFDWQMKLVMSSDKLSSIHEPLLNLDLQTKDSNNQSKVISLELNKDDLKKLITSLDGASKAVQQLST